MDERALKTIPFETVRLSDLYQIGYQKWVWHCLAPQKPPQSLLIVPSETVGSTICCTTMSVCWKASVNRVRILYWWELRRCSVQKWGSFCPSRQLFDQYCSKSSYFNAYHMLHGHGSQGYSLSSFEPWRLFWSNESFAMHAECWFWHRQR